MQKILTNAFSLNMVSAFPVDIHAEGITLDEARDELQGKFTNAIGHADTAAVYSEELGIPVEANRVSLALTKGDVLIVGQYRGPRLPEGCKTLPGGATIEWLRVSL